jgi:hypothetical protein
MQLIEISCAALTDKMFFGESKCVLEAYLLNTLKLIERNEVAREEFLGLLQEPKTFINIRLFLERHRKAFKALNQQQPA